jgi:AcrR family transcriptional regulator
MALPRGRHDLSAEDVVGDQRWRMLAGMASALAECGYARLTVEDVLKRAGVSRRTFYEQFEDKDDCLYAAYDEAEKRVWERAAAAAGEIPPLADAAEAPAGVWPAKVHAALAAVLELFAAEPDTARLFTLEARAAGPAMAARHTAALDRLAATLRAGNRPSDGDRGGVPGAADAGLTGDGLPDSTERMLLANVAALIGSYVISGATELLPSLEPQLSEHLLAPYREAVG